MATVGLGITRNGDRIVVGIPLWDWERGKAKCYLDVKIMLQKSAVNVWTGFDWFSVRPKSELLRTQHWTIGLYKSIYLLTRRAALDFQTSLLPVSVQIVKPRKTSHRLAPCTSPLIYYAHHCSYLAILFTRMLILITTSWLSLATIYLDWLVEGSESCKDSRNYRGIFEGIHLDLSSDYFCDLAKGFY